VLETEKENSIVIKSCPKFLLKDCFSSMVE